MILNRISKIVSAAMLFTSLSALSSATTLEHVRLEGDASRFNEAKHTLTLSGKATATMPIAQGSTLQITAKKMSVIYGPPLPENKTSPENVMQLDASSEVRITLDGKLIAEGKKAYYDAKHNTLRVTGNRNGTRTPEGIVIDMTNGAVKS